MIGTGGRIGTVGTGGASGGFGTVPAGYWTSGPWHGCISVETDRLGGTTASPLAYSAQMDSGSYCLSGSVEADSNYLGFAGLQFNLAQPPAGADCSYNPANVTRTELPAVEVTTPTLLSAFTTECFLPTNLGDAYAGQPLSAILILVTNPSTTTPAPCNFCISNLVGFSAL